MKIAVIDGQGGGIGKYIIQRLRDAYPQGPDIIALGTNALATSNMLKAGANDGASGEHAIIYMAPQVDVIVGSLAIIVANAFFGELTPQAASAITASPALKLLLPVNRTGILIAGESAEPLPHQVDRLLVDIGRLIEGENNV